MHAKKILYFCNYFQPMHYGENEISAALVKMGLSVTVVTGNRYFPFPHYLDTAQKLIGKRQRKEGIQREKGMKIIRNRVWVEFASRALFFGVRSALASYEHDTVLVSGISTPVAVQVALFAPRSTRCIYIDSNLPSELENGNQISKKIFYFFFRLFFAPVISRRADKVIAVQEATATIIQNVYGITKPPVVISHGTDSTLFVFTRRERKRIRKKFAIHMDDFVVIYSGKVIPAKGVHILFQAIGKLLQSHSDIHLFVVGDGPKEYTKKCMSYIPASYRGQVHSPGFLSQEELPAYYSSADVGVWPLQESLAMNDAVSCGLPIIVNDQIGVKERISNKNALLYKQSDVSDLVSCIEKMYTDPAMRKEMGSRGRELVEMKMSWLQKAREYIA